LFNVSDIICTDILVSLVSIRLVCMLFVGKTNFPAMGLIKYKVQKYKV